MSIELLCGICIVCLFISIFCLAERLWQAVFPILILISLIVWISCAVSEPISYHTKERGLIFTAVSDDQQIISTVVYEIGGHMKMIELDGFLPAGMKVYVHLPNHQYYGILFPDVFFQPKIEVVEDVPDEDKL